MLKIKGEGTCWNISTVIERNRYRTLMRWPQWRVTNEEDGAITEIRPWVTYGSVISMEIALKII
jgi:hypothetical protein